MTETMIERNDCLLVKIGKEKFKDAAGNSVHLVDDPVENAFLNDLENYPHAFLLACFMDRQTKSERAWELPIRVKNILGDFSIRKLGEVTKEEYEVMFGAYSLHRYPDIMAEVFYEAVQRIITEYDGDASKIWADTPSSATVVYRLLQFKGVGVKIATMAANILARQFKIFFRTIFPSMFPPTCT